MAWTWSPDPPNNFGWPMSATMGQQGPTLQDILMGQNFLEELKKKTEAEVKEKRKSKFKITLPKLTLLESWGLVFLLAIPVTMSQLWLLSTVQSSLNALFSGNPHP